MTQVAAPTAQPLRALTPESLEGDLIQPGHPFFGILWINKDRMGGSPCFAGTRVPIQMLFDYLRGGEPIDEFLAGFDGVTRQQAEAVLALAANGLLDSLPHQ